MKRAAVPNCSVIVNVHTNVSPSMGKLVRGCITDGLLILYAVSDAFNALTRDTPVATVYVILAVTNREPPANDSVYTGSLAFTGGANCFSNVCVADTALSRPAGLPSATTTMLTLSVCAIEIVALVPLTDVVTPVVRTLLSDAFLTCTAVTPVATVYVMLAVVPEYVMLPDSVGAANWFSNVCGADAALSRPLALPSATTTRFNGDSASVNGTVIVAVNELMELVAPEIGVLSDAFLTCTWMTSESTRVYVMLAV